MQLEFAAESISEVCKWAEIMLVIPIGPVQNERAFCQMNLILNDLRSNVGECHLNACIRAKCAKFNLKPACSRYSERVPLQVS